MQAILVRYTPPTKTRSGRYTARANAGRITVTAGKIPHDCNEPARFAAEALCKKFGWNDGRGDLIGGTLHTGDMIYTFDHPLNRKEAA
jgi:hypothetical protein